MTSKEKTKALLSRLSNGIKAIQSSEEFKVILDCMTKFRSYSWRNTLLIHIQYPEASRVAGYRTWQKLGRQVKKGEKGIGILAPSVFTKKETETDPETGQEVEVEQAVTYFVPVHVFDISQTEGDDLPRMQYNAIDDTHGDILEKLLGLAKENNIEVEFKDLPNCEGISTGGKIAVRSDKNPTEQALILIHELAHEFIHWTNDERTKLTAEQKELEAESTAYVVAGSLGIPETNSDRYLALYHKSYDLGESLEVIHRTSQTILGAVINETPAEHRRAA